MPDRPARQTRAATSRRRESWAGHGERQVSEKDAYGVFLDDVTYVFADVSVFGLPTLYFLMVSANNEYFGLKFGALVAWLTVVVVGALIRGGWITPLATDVPGWVAMTPWLAALRLGYYNATLLLAAFVGRAIGVTVSGAGPTAWSVLASFAFAVALGGLSAGVFPRVAESFYAVVAE